MTETICKYLQVNNKYKQNYFSHVVWDDTSEHFFISASLVINFIRIKNTDKFSNFEIKYL